MYLVAWVVIVAFDFDLANHQWIGQIIQPRKHGIQPRNK